MSNGYESTDAAGIAPGPAESAAASESDRQRRWRAVLLGITGAILVIGAVLTPSAEATGVFGTQIPSFCLVGNLTESGCPGCGMTRSVSFVMHGELRQAFAAHRLGIGAAAVFAASAAYLAVALVLDRRGRISWRKERAVLQLVLCVAAVALIVNWAIKRFGL